jgi:hypothetical protein
VAMHDRAWIGIDFVSHASAQAASSQHGVSREIRLRASLLATNAKRLRKGAKRRSNPFFLGAARWIASLRSQ